MVDDFIVRRLVSTSTRISVEQYDAMILRGEFEPRKEHHVELLYGEIVKMCPIGPPHSSIKTKLVEWSFRSPPPRSMRVILGALSIKALDSEPEPDLAWARRLVYRSRRPAPENVRRVIEVADSSLANDRGLKVRLYAEAGIADYGIGNLVDCCIEVRREPKDGAYQSVESYGVRQEVRPLVFPEAALAVDRVFPS